MAAYNKTDWKLDDATLQGPGRENRGDIYTMYIYIDPISRPGCLKNTENLIVYDTSTISMDKEKSNPAYSQQLLEKSLTVTREI